MFGFGTVSGAFSRLDREACLVVLLLECVTVALKNGKGGIFRELRIATGATADVEDRSSFRTDYPRILTVRA